MTRGHHSRQRQSIVRSPFIKSKRAGTYSVGNNSFAFSISGLDNRAARRKLKVLVAVAVSFFILWLSIKVFAQDNLWPLLAVPILVSAMFFYEIGALVTIGLSASLLAQASFEETNTILIAISTFAFLGMTIGWSQRRQSQNHHKILKSSLTDSLTNLYNYGYFIECLEREISRVDRYGGSISLVMFDIDHFKLFNDRYGHQAGNNALKAMAATLRREKRESDIVARYGGEEFVMLLPDDEQAGYETADRMREVISQTQVPIAGTATTGITVSAGVACYPANARSKEELIDKVDQLLYSSKSRGRNRVSMVPENQQLAV